MHRCLNAESLEALARGRLPEAARADAEKHVEGCRRCAEALARLPVGEDLLASIRDLHRAREELRPALAQLTQAQRRLTTTLFSNPAH